MSSLHDTQSRPVCEAAEATDDALTVESGLEALRTSEEFHGPVEPLDGVDDHEGCEHLALFYETLEERFAAVVPYVRQGIERGERVVYVTVDDTDRRAVIEALRAGDVAVDDALASGQLTFHTVDETYLRDGEFDPDGMLEFYGSFLEDATAEYPALRITAGTEWIGDDRVDLRDFMAYESRVNDLFEGEDCIALCHYDREAIPAEILRDVLRTHPHLIYDGTVCHNFYYTPPEKYLGPEEPDRDVARMLNTLADRTRARADLDDTIQELAESNERLERFAYVASHDLQEPLRMVSSYLQLLEQRYGDDLEEDATEYMDFAVRGADRMREMIDGLLRYSRVGVAEGSVEPMDCDGLLDDVLTDLELRIEATETTVTVRDLPTVHGDGSQLEQVFENLVSNAVKYSGTEPPSIEVAAEERPDSWLFTVADDGIGIDPAHQDQVFEVFSRLHTEAEYEGTGIGLALCQRIVEQHGGDIWIDSRPGEGTTVFFTLPKVREETA